MGIENPFPKVKLTEAPESVGHWKQVFSVDNINRLYPKHGKEILQIFKHMCQIQIKYPLIN